MNPGDVTRAIWPHPEKSEIVQVIDQRFLPHEFVILDLATVDEAIFAIKEMVVRGAPLIGATAGWAMYLAACTSPDGTVSDAWMETERDRIKAARPTAVNLAWACDRVWEVIRDVNGDAARLAAIRKEAMAITDEESENCRKIGLHGLSVIREIAERKKGPVNILTHCNAGWLACVEFGTATAPIYAAFDAGIDVHVWVDETRPLNQGARLTAWELEKKGVPHTVIVDNVGGHIMQHGMVDLVITGTDRTTAGGDVANKIGTYLKALAARDNGVPFWVALPSSTFDWTLDDGVKEIPIEERNPDEVRFVQGRDEDGKLRKVLVANEKSPARDYAFDVTPRRLVAGFITERGLCAASREGIEGLFPEKFAG